VFNAIVALDDRQNTSTSSTGSQQQPPASTASTTIIRRAPSILEDEPPLSRTDETEAIYAEPAPREPVRYHDDFVEPEDFVEAPRPSPPPKPQAPTRAAAPRPEPPKPAPPPPAPRQGPTNAMLGRPGLPKPEAARPEPPRPEAPRPVAQRPSAPPPAPPPSRVVAPPPPPPDDPDDIPETALEFNPAATDVTQVFIESPPARRIDWKREATGTFETVVLKTEEGPKPPPEAPPPPPPPPPRQRDAEDLQIENDLRSLAAKLDATGNMSAPRFNLGANEATVQAKGSPYNSADNPNNVALKAAKRAVRPAPANAARRAEAANGVIEEDVDEEGAEAAAQEFTPPPKARGKKGPWIAGIAALGVVLAAQAVHHNRHDLATNPTLNRPLTRLYAAIGVPLVPRWDLTSYDVRQLGASTSEGDASNLTVRASLKNSAAQPLPLPLLRITVQDRYGNRIATRDVEPKGYVPGAVPAGALLGVGQRIDAEMTFKDPGRDAVGFEIDACLPAPGGGITCANDAIAR
jgi:hypothetical protein